MITFKPVFNDMISLDNSKKSSFYFKKYKEKIKELINLDKLSSKLLHSILDKVTINKARNIEIFYKFYLLNNI